MANRSVIKLIIISIFIQYLTGCASMEATPVPTPMPDPGIELMSTDIVDRKIELLEKWLADESLTESDRQTARKLLSDYKTVRDTIKNNMTDPDYLEIIEILLDSTDTYEKIYLLQKPFEKPDESYSLSRAINEFSSKKRKILDSYLAGDYQGVISQCVDLESTFGTDSLTPEIGLLFAVSLAEQGMKHEAVSIGERIIKELEGKPDLVYLRANIIEWQLEMGNKDKALQTYQKLIDNMGEMESIFESAKQNLIHGETENASHKKPLADKNLISKTDEASPDQMTILLKEVDELVKQGSYTNAKLLLIKKRLRIGAGPDAEIIEQALKSVELAEEKYQQGPSLQEKTNQIARKLMEEEKFEEAVEKLEELKNEQILESEETRALKNRAIEELISSERDRAAKIFLMVRKTNDPQEKKELLISSRNILQSLVEKYPTSTLIYKLKSNLKTVEAELGNLDNKEQEQ